MSDSHTTSSTSDSAPAPPRELTQRQRHTFTRTLNLEDGSTVRQSCEIVMPILYTGLGSNEQAHIAEIPRQLVQAHFDGSVAIEDVRTWTQRQMDRFGELFNELRFSSEDIYLVFARVIERLMAEDHSAGNASAAFPAVYFSNGDDEYRTGDSAIPGEAVDGDQRRTITCTYQPPWTENRPGELPLIFPPEQESVDITLPEYQARMSTAGRLLLTRLAQTLVNEIYNRSTSRNASSARRRIEPMLQQYCQAYESANFPSGATDLERHRVVVAHLRTSGRQSTHAQRARTLEAERLRRRSTWTHDSVPSTRQPPRREAMNPVDVQVTEDGFSMIDPSGFVDGSAANGETTGSMSNSDGWSEREVQDDVLPPGIAQALLATAPPNVPQSVLRALRHAAGDQSYIVGLSAEEVRRHMRHMMDDMRADLDDAIARLDRRDDRTAVAEQLRRELAEAGEYEERSRRRDRARRAAGLPRRPHAHAENRARFHASGAGWVPLPPRAVTQRGHESFSVYYIDNNDVQVDTDAESLDSGSPSPSINDSLDNPEDFLRFLQSASVDDGISEDEEDAAVSDCRGWTGLHGNAVEALQRELEALWRERDILPADGERSRYLGHEYWEAMERALGCPPLRW